jgi:hypothetical protein
LGSTGFKTPYSWVQLGSDFNHFVLFSSTCWVQSDEKSFSALSEAAQPGIAALI